MGKYVVDFCSQEKKLIIELDGSQHAEISNKLQDLTRQQFLESKGYTILRFWNNDITENLEGVLESIRRATGN